MEISDIEKLAKCFDTDGDQSCIICKSNPNICPNRDADGNFVIKHILTTEDGVNIMPGEPVWWLRKPNATVTNKELLAWQYGRTKKMESPDTIVFLYFAAFENLRSYIVKEKPNVSLDDISAWYNLDKQIIIQILENNANHIDE